MPSRLAVRTLLRQRIALLMMVTTLPAAAILPLLPALPAGASTTPTLLGAQGFYTLDTHQLWDKANVAVNVASGDLIFHDTVLQIAGIAGHNLDLNLFYNSLSNGAGGGADFGSDWVMSAGGDVKLTIGTSITYQGPSSFQQVFTGTAPNWTTPAGMDATLYGPTGSSQYTLTYHDNGQVLTFNSAGQLTSNADRNGNTFTYAYNADGTLHQITDVAGSRTVSFNYNGGGNVSTVVDNSLSRTYTFTINGSHNLTGYADPANPSKTAQFTYDTGGKHEIVDIKDPAGNGETKLTYDTNHRVTQLQYVYDSLGDTYNRTYTYNSGTTGSACSSNEGEYADNSQGGAYQQGAYQYYNGARYYEAGQMNGHMTQLDPNNFPFATQGWNQYNYAGADSANLSDPNGMLFGPVNLNSPFRNGMILPRTGVVPAPLPPPSQWSCYFGGVFCRVQLNSNQTDGLIGALGIAGPTTAWLSGVTAGAVLLDKSLHGGTGAVLCVLAGQPPVLC